MQNTIKPLIMATKVSLPYPWACQLNMPFSLQWYVAAPKAPGIGVRYYPAKTFALFYFYKG